MKIISINANHTKNILNIAFNVDTSPLDGVINKVKNEFNLNIYFENNLLYIEIPSEHEGKNLISIIKSINEKFAKYELEVKEKIATDKAEHELALEQLKEITGLPIQ